MQLFSTLLEIDSKACQISCARALFRYFPPPPPPPSHPVPHAHSFFLVYSAGIAVGFYGNGETCDGVNRLTYSLRHANRTIAGIQKLVRLPAYYFLILFVLMIMSYHTNITSLPNYQNIRKSQVKRH